MIEIKWHDVDPDTGSRRYLCAERFAGIWRFRWKLQRRGDWTRWLEPTKAMWEHVLDSLERRYRRREGVSDEDLAAVKQVLQEWREEVQVEEGTENLKEVARLRSERKREQEGDQKRSKP